MNYGQAKLIENLDYLDNYMYVIPKIGFRLNIELQQMQQLQRQLSSEKLQ